MLCSNKADGAEIDSSERALYVGRCTSQCRSNPTEYSFLKKNYSTPQAPATEPQGDYEDINKLMAGPGETGVSGAPGSPTMDSRGLGNQGGMGAETAGMGNQGGAGAGQDSAEMDAIMQCLSSGKTSAECRPSGDQGSASQASGGDGSAAAKRSAATPNPNSPECAACELDDCSAVCGRKSGASEGNAQSAESQVNQCTQAHSTAMNDCDTERQSWMKNIQMAAQGLGPVMEEGACGKLASANVGASTSLATFKVMCNTATEACVAACSNKFSPMPDEMEQFSKNLSECRKKGTKAAEAEQAAAQGTQQLMAAVATCKNTFGVNSNPFNINNDPYKGMTAEEIMAGLQPGQGGGSLDYSGSKGAGGATGNSSFDLSGLEQDEELGKPKAAAKSAGGAIGGSMGSAGMGGGGGAGVDAGGGGSGGGKRPAGLLSNILSGFFGGAGGGGLFGGTGRGKGGLSGLFGGEAPQTEKTPDLRQFMPGGALDPRKARGLAGQKVSADGMSGPHGNIWRMINNRYQYKRASLLP